MTPDVYNTLVNLGKIINKSNPKESMKQLSLEKELLINNSTFRGEVLANGV